MSNLRVPRVFISIPSGHTSREKFEPRYALPLYRAYWAPSMPDPMIQVSEQPHPPEIKDPAFYWADISSVEEEYARLSFLFPSVFDKVYPSFEAFSAAVEKEMNRGIDIEAAIERATTPDEEIEVEVNPWLKGLVVKGLDDKKRRDLAFRGLDTPSQLQKTEVLKLAEIVGGRVAKALKKSCEGATDVLELESAE